MLSSTGHYKAYRCNNECKLCSYVGLARPLIIGRAVFDKHPSYPTAGKIVLSTDCLALIA